MSLYANALRAQLAAEAEDPGIVGSFEAGRKSAVGNAEINRTLGMAALRRAAGDIQGSAQLEAEAAQRQQALQAQLPKVPTRYEDAEGLGGALSFVANAVGSGYGSLQDQLPTGLGAAAAAVAARRIPGLTGLAKAIGPKTAAATAVGGQNYMTHLGDDYQTFRQEKPDEELGWSPFLSAAAKAGIEMATLPSHFKNIEQTVKRGYTPLQTLGKATIVEGLEEAAQTGVDHATATINDYKEVPGASEYVNSFLAGAIGGAGVAAPGAALNAARNKLQTGGQSILDQIYQPRPDQTPQMGPPQQQLDPEFLRTAERMQANIPGFDDTDMDRREDFMDKALGLQELERVLSDDDYAQQLDYLRTRRDQLGPNDALFRNAADRIVGMGEETLAARTAPPIEPSYLDQQGVEAKQHAEYFDQRAKELTHRLSQIASDNPLRESLQADLEETTRLRSESRATLFALEAKAEQRAELMKSRREAGQEKEPLVFNDSQQSLIDEVKTAYEITKTNPTTLPEELEGLFTSTAQMVDTAALANALERLRDGAIPPAAVLSHLGTMRKAGTHKDNELFDMADAMLRSDRDAGPIRGSTSTSKLGDYLEEDTEREMVEGGVLKPAVPMDKADTEAEGFDEWTGSRDDAGRPLTTTIDAGDTGYVMEDEVATFYNRASTDLPYHTMTDRAALDKDLQELSTYDPNAEYTEVSALDAIQTRLDNASGYAMNPQERDAAYVREANKILASQSPPGRTPKTVATRAEAEALLKNYSVIRHQPNSTDPETGDNRPIPLRLTRPDPNPTRRARKDATLSNLNRQIRNIKEKLGINHIVDLPEGHPARAHLISLYQERFAVDHKYDPVFTTGDLGVRDRGRIFAPATDAEGNPASVNVQQLLRDRVRGRTHHSLNNKESLRELGEALNQGVGRLMTDFGINMKELPPYVVAMTKKWGENIYTLDLQYPDMTPDEKIALVEKMRSKQLSDMAQSGADPALMADTNELYTGFLAELEMRAEQSIAQERRTGKTKDTLYDGVTDEAGRIDPDAIARAYDEKIEKGGLQEELQRSVQATRGRAAPDGIAGTLRQAVRDALNGKELLSVLNDTIEDLVGVTGTLGAIKYRQNEQLAKFTADLGVQYVEQVVALKSLLGERASFDDVRTLPEQEFVAAGADPAFADKVYNIVENLNLIEDVRRNPSKHLFGGNRSIQEIQNEMARIEDLYEQFVADDHAMEQYSSYMAEQAKATGLDKAARPQLVVPEPAEMVRRTTYTPAGLEDQPNFSGPLLPDGMATLRGAQLDGDTLKDTPAGDRYRGTVTETLSPRKGAVNSEATSGINAPGAREYLVGDPLKRQDTVKPDRAKGKTSTDRAERYRQRRALAGRMLESIGFGTADSHYTFAHQFVKDKKRIKQALDAEQMGYLWDEDPAKLRKNLERLAGRRQSDIIFERTTKRVMPEGNEKASREAASSIVSKLHDLFIYDEAFTRKNAHLKMDADLNKQLEEMDFPEGDSASIHAVGKLHARFQKEFGVALDNAHFVSPRDLARVFMAARMRDGLSAEKARGEFEALWQGNGLHVPFTMPDGSVVSLFAIKPTETTAVMVEAYFHEAGHALFTQLLENPRPIAKIIARKGATEAQIAAIEQQIKQELEHDYQTWKERQKQHSLSLQATGKAENTMRGMPLMVERTLRRMKDDPAGLAQYLTSDEHLQRGEYMADMVGRYMLEADSLAEARKSVLGKFFAEVAKKLKAVLTKLRGNYEGTSEPVKHYLDTYLKETRARRAENAKAAQQTRIEAYKALPLVELDAQFDGAAYARSLLESMANDEVLTAFDALDADYKPQVWSQMQRIARIAANSAVNTFNAVAAGKQELSIDSLSMVHADTVNKLTASLLKDSGVPKPVRDVMQMIEADVATVAAFRAMYPSDRERFANAFAAAVQSIDPRVEVKPNETVDQEAVDAQERKPYGETAQQAAPESSEPKKKKKGKKKQRAEQAGPTAAPPPPPRPRQRPKREDTKIKVDPYSDAEKAEAARMLEALQAKVRGLRAKHALNKLDPVDFLELMSDATADFMQAPDRLGSALRKLLMPKEYDLVSARAQDPAVLNKLRGFFKDEPATLKRMNEDPDFTIGLMVLMDEAGLVSAKQQAFDAAESMILQVQAFLHPFTGVVGDDNLFHQTFAAIKNGEISKRGLREGDFVLPEPAREHFTQRAYQKLFDLALQGRDKVFGPLMNFAYQRVLNIRNPQLTAAMHLIYTPATSEGREQSMISAIGSGVGQFNNQLVGILGKNAKDKQFMEQLGKALVSPEDQAAATEEVSKAADRIRAEFLPRVADYLRKTGVVDATDREFAYPWMMDPAKLGAQREAFLELLRADNVRPGLEQFQKELEAAKQAYYQQYLRYSAQKAAEMAKRNTPSIEDLPEYIYDQVMDNNGMANIVGEHFDVHNPSFKPLHKHDLNFLRELATDAQRAQLTSYMNTNAGETLFTYTRQAVERGEYTKRFGRHGERLNQYLTRAKRTGATDQDIKLFLSVLAAVNGRHGRDTKDWLADMMDQLPVSQAVKDSMRDGATMNPRLQQAFSWITMYQNYRLLPLAPLTAVGDFGGVAARSGDFATFAKGVKAVFTTADRAELTSLGNVLGLLDSHLIADSTMSARYMGAPDTRIPRMANDALFTYTGMKWITDFTRKAAMASAMEFLKRHATQPNSHSSRYLAELGVFKEDVKLESGKLKLLTEEERAAATDAVRAADDRIRNAIYRFVEQSVVVPNAANKPLYMSDGHFALITHLKPYIWAMHENVSSRLFKGLARGDVLPIALAYLTYVPILTASEELREVIKYGPEGNPRRANWDAMDKLEYAVGRSGLSGYWSMLSDAKTDREYGGIGIESWSGPTGGLALREMRDVTSWRDYMPLQAALKHHL